MPKSVFTPTEDKFILNNKDKMTWAEIGDKLGGKDRETVRKRYWNLKKGKTEPKTAHKDLNKVYAQDLKETGIFRSETDGGCVVRSADPTIRSLEDLVRVCKIDLGKWHIVRSEVNAYNSFAKTSSRKVAEDHWVKDLTKVTLFQVKVQLQPREHAVDLNEFQKQFLMKVRNERVILPMIPRRRYTHDSFMYEIAILDHHFGKHAWKPETGDDYDLKIATEQYKLAMRDLLSRAEGLPIEEILIPTGHDMFHIDSMLNVTTSGTPQDVDGRWQKSFTRVYELMVWAIKMARQIAPVTIKMVPGNHDRQRVFYLGEALKARFHDVKDVTIDNGPTSRKYHHYGVTLLGLTHGCDEKMKDLPSIMANEVPELWSGSFYRTWHIGHLHKQSEETIGGVNIRHCPSLCGTDAWHNRMGYIGSPKLAEAFLYHKTKGLQTVHVYSPPNPDLQQPKKA